MSNSPLEAWCATVRYINAVIKMHPDRHVDVSNAQCKRLIGELNNMTIDQCQATQLLEVLCNDDEACPFSAAQKGSISDLLQGSLDEDMTASPVRRSHCKEQQHMFLAEYLPQVIWDVLQSDDTLNNKFKHVAHFCVETLQLRNPDAQTRRVLVALTHVASDVDKGPDGCFDDFSTIRDIFKMKRDEMPGPQSLRAFPEDVQKFIDRYPGAYPDDKPPAKCPLQKKAIKARLNKKSIPCRGNNAMLASALVKRKHVTSCSAITAASPDTHMSPMQVLQTCMAFMQGSNGSNAASSGDGMLPGFKFFGNGNGNTTASEVDTSASPTTLVGRKDKLPGCLQIAGTGGQGNLADLRDKLRNDMIENATKRKRENAKKANEENDEEEGDDEDNEEEDETEEDEEKAEKVAMKKPVRAACKAKEKNVKKAVAKTSKGPKLDGQLNPTAVEVLAKRKSVNKFASSLADLAKHKGWKGRPKATFVRGKLEKVEYMTGRIYPTHQTRPVMRVYTRKGDTHEQRFQYNPKDNDDVKKKWHLACSAIELDPRVADID
jgi:hypothetical protein